MSNCSSGEVRGSNAVRASAGTDQWANRRSRHCMASDQRPGRWVVGAGTRVTLGSGGGWGRRGSGSGAREWTWREWGAGWKGSGFPRLDLEQLPASTAAPHGRFFRAVSRRVRSSVVRLPSPERAILSRSESISDIAEADSSGTPWGTVRSFGRRRGRRNSGRDQPPC